VNISTDNLLKKWYKIEVRLYFVPYSWKVPDNKTCYLNKYEELTKVALN